ncbi:MAG: SpoIIE family protein phosphatase [Negativicutes bacterium]|nr:SpoIIE family protein phosphatase [Negativicutes bacterium]
MKEIDPKKKIIVYSQDTLRIIILACFIIVIAVVMTGSISYVVTERAVVDKLKKRDLVYTMEAIAAKVDGRILRAKETARLMAHDLAIREWVAGEEQDAQLGRFAKQKLADVASQYDYNNSFIVSSITGNYWAENGQCIDVMSKDDPDDAWFFETIQAGRPVDLNIDYNSERGDTFVFINALVTSENKPLAVTGVGLSLKELARDFQTYKFGERSNLWLIDRRGKIHLSEDVEHTGKDLLDFLPVPVVATILQDFDSTAGQPKIFEYQDELGNTVDIAYVSARSTDWKLIFQLPREESVAMLRTIKINAAVGSMISLALIMFIFYLVSNRIANPFKRAIAISQEMEKQVRERTQELAATNQKIMDSINYAKRIQEAVLPAHSELSRVFKDYFVIWQPRDTVGGDFYWLRQNGAQCLLAVADCTGHGAPGAFMTMALNSILNYTVSDMPWNDPAAILKRLNREMKETIHRKMTDEFTDDGMDIGVCYIEDSHKLVFSGAKLSLVKYSGGTCELIRGDRKSIGYKRSQTDAEFTNYEVVVNDGDVFYLTTDGYLDQNGGERDFSFGRTRFLNIAATHGHLPLATQREIFENSLAQYMAGVHQRDDITVFGFRL